MKKLMLIFSIMFLAVSTLTVFAEEEKTTMTIEEYNKKVKEATEFYQQSLQKMTGNFDAYYLLYDYMGRGYVKLDVDIMIHMKNFANIKSDMWTVSFNAIDDAKFTVKQNWKVKKSDIFVNGEGDGIFIKKFNLEKGIYRNVTITVTGNMGETASVNLPEYSTLQLSDLKTKVGKAFLINAVDAGDKVNMFVRRGKVFVPNLIAVYDKVKMFGFYIEYYHLVNDAMHNEGEYELSYSIFSMAFGESIFDQKIAKKEVPKNGFVVVPPIDISSATAGIYRLDVTFKDIMGNQSFSQSLYFSVVKDETNEKKPE